MSTPAKLKEMIMNGECIEVLALTKTDEGEFIVYFNSETMDHWAVDATIKNHRLVKDAYLIAKQNTK